VSPELKKALSAWLVWAEKGGEPHEHFTARGGLCANIDRLSGSMQLSNELILIFKEEGYHVLTPFGRDNYDRRYHSGTQHQDPARLEWVRSHLEEY